MASSISYQNMGSNGGCFEQCHEGATPSMALGNSSLNRNRYDTPKEMKSTEDFLASELSKLSVQERTKALDDLHCVGEDLTETSELIKTSLAEMHRLLAERNDPIYEIAKKQNRDYVEDPNFRLRFIRANNHDIEKAVTQLLGFLTHKETYFGRDKLARDITLNDMSHEDIDLLPLYHIQDGTDRNGRMVVHILNHVLSNKIKAETLIRLNYFVFFNLLSHLEAVQRKGVVVCYYDMATEENPVYLPPLNVIMKYVAFVAKVPVRRSAMHLCLKAIPGSLASNNIILGKLLQGLQRAVRTRARVHYGSDIELQYTLRSHGFPSKTIPVDDSGNIRKNILNVWFDKYVANQWDTMFATASHLPMSAVEKRDAIFTSLASNTTDVQGAAASPANCISPTTTTSERLLIKPTPTDVLLGRGRATQMHAGNERFREFLKAYQDDYNNTPRYKRLKTHTDITQLLLDDGVRFLQKTEDGSGWVQSDFAAAEKKVKQFFRSQKKLKATF